MHVESSIYKSDGSVRSILRTQHVYRVSRSETGVWSKDNQPFFMTQNTITEIFKYVMGFCAMEYGDAINIAISILLQDMHVISYGLSDAE